MLFITKSKAIQIADNMTICISNLMREKGIKLKEADKIRLRIGMLDILRGCKK